MKFPEIKYSKKKIIVVSITVFLLLSISYAGLIYYKKIYHEIDPKLIATYNLELIKLRESGQIDYKYSSSGDMAIEDIVLELDGLPKLEIKKIVIKKLRGLEIEIEAQDVKIFDKRIKSLEKIGRMDVFLKINCTDIVCLWLAEIKIKDGVDLSVEYVINHPKNAKKILTSNQIFSFNNSVDNIKRNTVVILEEIQEVMTELKVTKKEFITKDMLLSTDEMLERVSGDLNKIAIRELFLEVLYDSSSTVNIKIKDKGIFSKKNKSLLNILSELDASISIEAGKRGVIVNSSIESKYLKTTQKFEVNIVDFIDLVNSVKLETLKDEDKINNTLRMLRGVRAEFYFKNKGMGAYLETVLDGITLDIITEMPAIIRSATGEVKIDLKVKTQSININLDTANVSIGANFKTIVDDDYKIGELIKLKTISPKMDLINNLLSLLRIEEFDVVVNDKGLYADIFGFLRKIKIITSQERKDYVKKLMEKVETRLFDVSSDVEKKELEGYLQSLSVESIEELIFKINNFLYDPMEISVKYKSEDGDMSVIEMIKKPKKVLLNTKIRTRSNTGE